MRKCPGFSTNDRLSLVYRIQYVILSLYYCRFYIKWHYYFNLGIAKYSILGISYFESREKLDRDLWYDEGKIRSTVSDDNCWTPRLKSPRPPDQKSSLQLLFFDLAQILQVLNHVLDYLVTVFPTKNVLDVRW